MLLIIGKDLCFIIFIDYYSAHAQNEDSQCFFNWGKLSCPFSEVYKSEIFVSKLIVIRSFWIFWNCSYCIPIKCDSMSTKCNNIYYKRILSNPITWIVDSFKLFNYLLSQINLFCFRLISNLICYIIALFFFEKICVVLNIIMWFKDLRKIFRLNFTVVIATDVQTLVLVGNLYWWLQLSLVLIIRFF